MAEEEIKLIAHRGYRKQAVMNSIKAFQEAGKRHYWAIETDVRKTSDGILVCSHDPVVDKLFDGKGEISKISWEDLKKLPYKSGQKGRIPLFSEYLDICRAYGSLPFIETKTDDIPEVLKTAEEFFPDDEIILSSIQFRHLQITREMNGNVFIHHIFGNRETMKKLAEMGNAGMSLNCPDPDDASQEMIDEIHSLGLKVCLRAGDSVEAVRKMMNLGLDYIPTNCVRPEDVREEFDERIYS